MLRKTCPICEKPASEGDKVGDRTVFHCNQCGSYQLSGTALEELEQQSRPKPDPKTFKTFVEKKRGASEDYPIITSYDLDALTGE